MNLWLVINVNCGMFINEIKSIDICFPALVNNSVIMQVVADIPYEQIKEITGCDDINKIKKVWNNCSAKGNNTAETITADVISSLCENRDIYEGPVRFYFLYSLS